MRVFDRDGRFIATLTRDDFELVENGEPQTIDALHLVGAGPGAAPDPSASPTALPPRPPVTDAPAARQTWIFFFDLQHLKPGGGFDRARRAVEDFIRDRLPNGDLAGILAGDQIVNGRLTSVKRELLDAVKSVKPRGDARSRTMELTREWPRLMDEEEAVRLARGELEAIRRAVTRACSDEPESCSQAEPAVREKGQRLQQDFHRAAGQTLATLNNLAGGLSRMPGPKTLVFLSDGFVTQDIETTLRSVVGQTTRAGARVYAIDVRGLNRTANPGIIDQAYVDDAAGPGTRFDGLADGPNSLAVDTGGLMIRNENNIGRALDRIADDAGRYYVLAYQPTSSTFDGKYRPIQVRVKGDGLRVRARRGYLALPPSRLLIPRPIVPTTDSVREPAPDRPAEPELPRVPVDEEPLPAPPPPTTVGTTVSSTAAPAVGVRLRPGAEARVTALSAGDTADTGALATAGWSAYQRGDVESAFAAFSQAAVLPGVRPWVLYALGMTQAALGQPGDAAASWERVRQAAPDFQPVYLDLADTYAVLSNLTAALATVRAAEARWPSSPDIHSAIGVILVRRGALDDGIAALVRTTELAPEDGLAFLNLGRAYALRYQRGRRYVTSQRRWVAPDADRVRAIEALERAAKIGGPYAIPAKEELSLLEWSKPG